MFNQFDNFNHFDNFGVPFVGDTYKPYIDYNWTTRSPIWHSGNPLDFQGSNWIETKTITKKEKGALFTKIGAVPNSNSSLIEVGGSPNRTYLGVQPNGTYGIGLGTDNWVSVNTSTEIKPQQNDSVCLVWENNTWKLYVNGSLADSGIYSGTTISTSLLQIGGIGGSFLTDTQLDYAVYYDDVPTLTQIQQSYTNPNQFYNSCAKVGGELYANTIFCTDFGGNSNNIKDDRNGIEYSITNYSPTMRTNFQTETTGMQELMIERDSLGFFLGLRDYPYSDGTKPYYAIVPNDARTTDITLQVKPDSLGGSILSGGVVLDTTGLTAGIDNDITLNNQTINADIKMFDGYAGEVKIYKEDLV